MSLDKLISDVLTLSAGTEATLAMFGCTGVPVPAGDAYRAQLAAAFSAEGVPPTSDTWHAALLGAATVFAAVDDLISWGQLTPVQQVQLRAVCTRQLAFLAVLAQNQTTTAEADAMLWAAFPDGLPEPKEPPE